MAKKKQPEPKGSSVPEYMATYGDLVTLLMCFFVLLFSMSTIEASKFAQVASALSGKTATIIDGGAGDSILSLVGTGIMEMPAIDLTVNDLTHDSEGDQGEESQKDVAEMASDFMTYFAENNMAEVMEVIDEKIQLRIRFPDGVLFDSGRAVLKPEYLGVLDIIAEELFNHPNVELRVEGHTDNVPMGGSAQFPDNMHLSAGRAISVAKYFMNEKHFDPARTEFVGYGEYRPIADNDTPENRARNRRVEIVIIPDSGAEAE